MVALNKLTGETVWKSPSAGDTAGYCSPVLAEYQGLRMIVTLSAKQIIGVNADNGELLWPFPKETKYNVNVMMPIVRDGQVFVSTGYGAGSVHAQAQGGRQEGPAEKVWESKELDNHHGGVILVDGYLYGAAHFGNKEKWVCLEWATGKKLWAEEGVGKGSATLCRRPALHAQRTRHGGAGQGFARRAGTDQQVQAARRRRRPQLGAPGRLRRPALSPPRRVSCMRMTCEGQ